VVANIAAVTLTLGPRDMKSFIELARSRPGQINYVNPGNGSSPHVSAELLQVVNGIKLTSINYKGIPPAIPDFLAGTVPFGFFPFGTIAGQIRSGKAQAIGIASPVRHKEFPELATMAEQGFESSQVNSWYAIAAPKKTPRAVIERLNRDLNAVLAEDETIARVDKIGGTVIAGWSAQQTTKMFADEFARWADVARKAGLAAR
jgi:tripartite-type tricarboxylate transporter receptor subunit TctC